MTICFCLNICLLHWNTKYKLMLTLIDGVVAGLSIMARSRVYEACDASKYQKHDNLKLIYWHQINLYHFNFRKVIAQSDMRPAAGDNTPHIIY